MSDATTDVQIRFESDATELAGAQIVVLSAAVAERLSALYEATLRFELQQELPFSRDEVAAILRATCRLRIATASVDRVTHGVLSELELLGPTPRGTIAYRAVLVPRLFELGRTHRSRVFQGMSVPAIVRRVLVEADLREGRDFELRLRRGPRAEPDELPEPGVTDDDFGDYPQREYTVQIEESDLAFVRRLLEQEGIAFFFEQTEEQERLVMADANAQHAELGEIAFASDHARDLGGHVTRIARAHRTVTARVAVRDYNWRTPQIEIAGEAVGDEAFGQGFAAYYGDHAKTPRESERYARLRAEELGVARETYSGDATSTELAPGARFTLTNAYSGDLDQPYLTVAVNVEAATPLDEESAGGYRLTFEAIPASTPFRPARTTPRPRIAGLMHARVDGQQIGKAAPIDAHGRYKVLLPWDLYGQAGGRASRWIRMAQPHAGDGYGMHFPLHIGTEILLAHLGGDPDRPVIVGSVPNPDTRSPVTDQNATQSQVRTRSGIVVEFEDDAR